ncbi:MAG: glutamine-hydrolyzing carbamoyl-phosphate synthase small subunit [Bacillota bacterium]|nr:glutamine-hydrolyzing carbamoyl-phosphate synthase small subunit [Bacillota bacterium]
MEGLIYLEDGTVYKGKGFGAPGTRAGELVFNTSMTGYQRILTDPSYKGQIINMTYPMIGNYGISREDNESQSIHAFGLIIKDTSMRPSNHRSIMNIDDWLKLHGTPGIWSVDTRQITRKIRREGTVKCVISNEGISPEEAETVCTSAVLREDWMKAVGVRETVHIEGPGKRVALLDMGVKGNILNSLKGYGCDIWMFPYGTSAEEMMAVKPQGLLLTNGPGDPALAVEAVEEVRKLIGVLPIFGICMGHQILALAMGGSTYKLKYGHRGANHGVYDKEIDRSYITSQNHGYAVKGDSIVLKGMEVTHINLNDGTVEGMKHRKLPVFSVQFHPEASPGPGDSQYLFAKFVKLMEGGAL